MKWVDVPLVVIVSGVSGSGKSTIGAAAARRLEWPFQEGDLLHDPASVEKMRHGTALEDIDRETWLGRVVHWIDERFVAGESGVITCSALKRSYRTLLRQGRGNVVLVVLRGPQSVIARRMASRKGHFMPASLLPSQFATFEPPSVEEGIIDIDITQPLERCVDEVVALVQKHRHELPPD